MFKNKAAKALSVLSAALLIAAVFCACTQAENAAEPSPSPSPSISLPSSSPEQLQAAATPDAAQTPFELNPVWTFCNHYSSSAGDILNRMEQKLSALENAEALEFSLMCSAHSRALSVLYLSIGRLTYTQSGLYSATISGAEAGSGTLNATESGYTFEFAYNNNAVLNGYFSTAEEYIEFTFEPGDDDALPLNVFLIHTDSGWLSKVSESIYDTEFFADNNGDGYGYFVVDDRAAVLAGDTICIGDHIPQYSEVDAVSSATP